MKRIRIAFVAAAMLVAFIVPSAQASHWSTRTLVASTVSQTCVGGTKIDDPNGIYTVNFGGTTGTVELRIFNGALSFSTQGPSYLVTTIMVKGGPTQAVKYTYSPGTTADDGLTAPNNPSSGKPYGVSHVCILGAKKTSS
jgi:hypothetical protein